MRKQHSLPLWILVSTLAACTALPSGEQAATPQRPTLAADTNTTPEGSFEFESGVTSDPGDFVDTPSTLKYGLGPRTEVFVGWSPFVELHGPDVQGPGDVTLGMRHRFRDETESAPALGLQSSVKLPTADSERGLGSGEVDATFAGIASKTFGEVSVTGFYQLGIIGDGSGATDVSHSVALDGSRNLGDGFGVFGELSAIFVPEVNSEQTFGLLGVTYTPRPSLVFDFGTQWGLNDEASDLQLVFGFTKWLGRPGGL